MDGSAIGRRRRPAATLAQWPLDAGINVVLFAGMGGACAGLEDAGCPVAVANNHDEVALAAHAALHPHTHHVKGDIFDVDPLVATSGRRVKVLWASPDCTDHSVAKGGAPRSPRVRSLPWQVCRWLGKTKAEVFFLENVREIRGWGPLVAKRCRVTGRVMKADGTVAAKGEQVPLRDQLLVRDKKRAGRSYRRWVRHIEGLGYAYQDRDMNCADYGVPTSRRRLFGVGRRDGKAIRWPARTHAPRDQAEALGLKPWRAAAEIIDWSLPIPSIFGRKRPLAEATQRRIAEGMRRFVLTHPRPFIVPVCHTSGPPRAHDGMQPLPTMTTAKGGEFAVVAPFTAGCGGRAGQVPPSGLNVPLRTATTKGDLCVVAPVLASLTHHGGERVHDLKAPIPTITTAHRGEIALTAATMVQLGYGEAPGQAPRALDIQAPLGTVVVGGAKHGVVAAWMAQHNLNAVGVRADAPLSTLTTAGTQQQVAAAYLAKLRGQSTATDAADPASTFSAGGNHIAAVAAFLTKYYGEGSTSQAGDEALHTLSCKARFGVVTVTIDGQPYAVSDIGMRMLEPSEAAAAHELRLPAKITLNGVTRALTKTEAMRLVGNSVPKRMARLLAEANVVHALEDAPRGGRVAA